MKYLYGLLIALCIAAPGLFAQTVPGKIIRTTSVSTSLHAAYFSPTVSSRQVLDPNGDGYVSSATSGFQVNDDVTGSEINYKPIMPYSSEPHSDLRRGPSHLYSDFVPGIDNASYYMYYRATAGSEALLFRMRLGAIMPGAKGYSILLDTDGRFGALGPNADPNYVAATTGTNGNAGFELEIDLFTQVTGQTGIAIYNVDGTSSPGTPLWSALNWQDYSQTSLASTSDNGDPDFFLDFFVPFSRLGITASTPLRAVATTVMAPLPAIGGPKSDIYGLSDAAYSDPNAQYEAFINAQPPFNAATLGNAGTASPTAQMCTAAPTINDITATGSIPVSGTWAKSSLSTLSTAVITLYRVKNGVTSQLGTTSGTVFSGTTWTIPNITVAAGDTVYAKAQAAGESQCLASNYVRVRGCTITTPTTGLNFTCITQRGLRGTMAATNQVVKLYTMTAGGPVLYATDGSTPSPNVYLITYSAATLTFEYNGQNNGGQLDACTGGPNDMPSAASFFYTVTSPGQCESAPILAVPSGSQITSCVGGTPTAVPTITQSVLYNTSPSVSGTAANNALVMLYQNGTLLGSTSTTSTSTAYSFSNLALSVNDKIEIYAYAGAAGCMSATAASRTVATCVTPVPVINTTPSGLLSIGQPITGTAVAGSTVRLYNTASTLLATTTVQSNGTWTTSGAAFSNGFTGMALASTSYYATCTSGSCTVSAASASASTGSGITPANRCGTITAYAPASSSITSSTTSITVAYANAANLKVTLYQDGQAVVSQSAPMGNGTVLFDVTGMLYAGNGTTTGILTIGVQEAGQEESSCPATYPVGPNCTAPAAPVVSPYGTQSISAGQTITYTIQGPTAGVFYSISDGTSGTELAPGVWASSTADFSMTTRPVTGPTTALVKAVFMTSSGEVCTSLATSRSVSVLPVTLLYFNGVRNGAENVLSWEAAEELNSSHYIIERSTDGAAFRPAGEVPVRGQGVTYSFTDRQPGSGTTYYRLRMVDIDGRFTYSKVVAIKRSTSGLLSEIYPNPFTASIRLQLQLPSSSMVEVRVVDGTGKTVRTMSVKGVEGTNIFHLRGLQELGAGVYVLVVRAGSETFSTKLLKANP